MDAQYGNDDAGLQPNRASLGGAHDETHDEFETRMIDEGASPEAAMQAAAGHFQFDKKPLPPGQLLPGWTARRWQEIAFVLLGCFLAELVGVILVAPAFHPNEPASEVKLLGPLFLATFLPIIVLMVGSQYAVGIKSAKEQRDRYTTLRWLTANPVEVRDSRGGVIPPGDKRLASSARYMHAFSVVGAACVVVSPLIWIVRLVIA
jgi:hypothetical protein